MQVLKIINYQDINNIKNYIESDFVVDLTDCRTATRRRVIDFLAGFTFLNGSLEKKNKNQFIVRGNK